jgi:hypothetical protein
MDVLYFAYANDHTQPLDELKREDNEITRLLQPLADQDCFRYYRDPYATLDQVADQLSAYRDRLVLFHYSGHAGAELLKLEDGPAHAPGIAGLLGQCPRLRVVVLNGCATAGQVRALHTQGIPAVVATHERVGDAKAATFALRFYRQLADRHTLEAAYESAKSYLEAKYETVEFDVTRGLALRHAAPATPCWTLSIAPGHDEMLQWRLPRNAPAHEARGGTQPPAPSEIVKKTRTMIAGGKTEPAIRDLLAYAEAHRPDLFAEIVQLSNRWEELAKKQRTGTIRFDDAMVQRNQIVRDLLETVGALE